MQLSLLDEFLEIATTGSVSKAAQKLHMSPSSLSRRLTELEKEIGVQLFFREPQFRLSPAGSTFLKSASNILSEYYQTLEECRMIACEKIETVFVQEYQVDDASSEVRFRIMTQAKTMNRALNVEMKVLANSNPIDALKKHVVDVAQTSFVIRPEELSMRLVMEGISLYPIVEEPLYVCFHKSHAELASMDIVPISSLRALRVRVPYGDYYSPYRDWLTDLYNANSLHPSFSFIKQRSGTLSNFYLNPFDTNDIYIIAESMTKNIWLANREKEGLLFKKIEGKKTNLTTCMLLLDTNKKKGVELFRKALLQHAQQSFGVLNKRGSLTEGEVRT